MGFALKVGEDAIGAILFFSLFSWNWGADEWGDTTRRVVESSWQQLLSITLQEYSPEYLFVRSIKQTLEFVFCWALIYFPPQINLHVN